MFSKNLKISSHKNFEQKNSPYFLIIFFYLTNSKRDNLELIIGFLQKYNIRFIKFENKKGSKMMQFLGMNVNYVAYCPAQEGAEPISPAQFKDISQYLSSKVLVVAFFHTNYICDLSRINVPFSSTIKPKGQPLMKDTFIL